MNDTLPVANLCISDEATFWPWFSWPDFATWPDKEHTLVVLPVAGLEDCGLDQPLDAEETVLMSVLKEASLRRRPGLRLLVVPPVRFVLGPSPSCAFPVDPDVACNLLEELAADSEHGGSKDSLEGSGERVLVVVEEAGQLSLMVDTLDSYGYEAHASQSGTAALQWIEACGLPDLVVLDADMNLYTGVRTLAALTEHGYNGAVILLGRPEAPPDLHELPPFDHLYVMNKPITTPLLLKTLRKALLAASGEQ